MRYYKPPLLNCLQNCGCLKLAIKKSSDILATFFLIKIKVPSNHIIQCKSLTQIKKFVIDLSYDYPFESFSRWSFKKKQDVVVLPASSQP